MELKLAPPVSAGKKSKHADQPGSLIHSEFICRLDRVDRVATGVGQANDLGLRCLRCHDVRGKIACVLWMLGRPQYRSTRFLDDFGGIVDRVFVWSLAVCEMESR